jgi:hypothetical protein
MAAPSLVAVSVRAVQPSFRSLHKDQWPVRGGLPQLKFTTSREAARARRATRPGADVAVPGWAFAKALALRLGLLFEPSPDHPTLRLVVPGCLMRTAVSGRVFGLNVGDWVMLLGSLALIGLLALLI